MCQCLFERNDLSIFRTGEGGEAADSSDWTELVDAEEILGDVYLLRLPGRLIFWISY